MTAIAGVAASSPTGPQAIATLGVVAIVWWVLARFGTGCLIGLLILGGLDALPGPNLETHILNSITSQDLVVTLLVAVLLYENSKDGFWQLRSTKQGRLLTFWCGVFTLWYAVTLVHTWTTTPVPLVHAITFSRQFVYFPVLLPLLFGPLRTKTLRDTVLATLAVGAVVSSVAQTAAVAGHVSLSFLLHINYGATTSGLTRIRGVHSDIPFAALPFGYGLVLYGQTPRRQALGAILALSGLLAVILGQTRAIYLGEAVGLTCATAIVLLSRDARARIGRRRFTRMSLAMFVGILVLYAYVPSNLTTNTLAAVGQRGDSLVRFLGSGSTDSSIETRNAEIASVEYAIRGHWWAGLGELDPTYDYVAGVPHGDIDQVDVSLLGGVAEIGIIGIAIYAIPLIAFLLGLLRERGMVRQPGEDDWLAFGGLAWCIGVIVVSPTLGLLFQPSETVGSAAMLALIGGWLADRDAMRTRG